MIEKGNKNIFNGLLLPAMSIFNIEYLLSIIKVQSYICLVLLLDKNMSPVNLIIMSRLWTCACVCVLVHGTFSFCKVGKFCKVLSTRIRIGYIAG